MSGRPEVPSPARLTIDLGALAANWRSLRDLKIAAECAAVVKADAYGIGIEPAVAALAAAGCATFFVAHLGEAARVLQAARAAIVYVFNGLLPGAAADFAAIGARPVLGSEPEIAEWAAFCRAAGAQLPAAIHVDTAMNRLGLSPNAFASIVAGSDLGAFEPALLMSHFASAEEADDPVNARQIAAFAAIRRQMPHVPASLANSSGLFLAARHPDLAGLALARPGYALYGGNPTPGRPNPMRPVVRLEAPIIQTRAVEPGARVGYNGRWTARRPSRLATIPIGYADGYLRSLGRIDTNGDGEAGTVLLAGRECPVVGRVSMDLSVIDVTDLSESEARRGALVTLIGDTLDIDTVGRRAGTIGYEILTSLGRRYERRYVGGP